METPMSPEIDADEFARLLRQKVEAVLDCGLNEGPYTIEEWWDMVRNELEEHFTELGCGLDDIEVEA
jgi:lipoate-protein ligase A